MEQPDADLTALRALLRQVREAEREFQAAKAAAAAARETAERAEECFQEARLRTGAVWEEFRQAFRVAALDTPEDIRRT